MTLPSHLISKIASVALLNPKPRVLNWRHKYAGHWNHWLAFCRRGEITNPYLDDYSAINSTRILCAFMEEVRNGVFSKQPYVKGDIVRQAADNVATTISSSGRKDPRLTESNQTHLMITRQTKSHRKVDKPPKHQKAIPPEVFRQALCLANHPRALARAHLMIGAVFFCMRSCEYSKTPNDEQKTRPIQACDITFRFGGLIIPHDSPHIDRATHVTIVFGLQKSDIIDEPVTQERSKDSTLCPVKSWIKVIR